MRAPKRRVMAAITAMLMIAGAGTALGDAPSASCPSGTVRIDQFDWDGYWWVMHGGGELTVSVVGDSSDYSWSSTWPIETIVDIAGSKWKERSVGGATSGTGSNAGLVDEDGNPLPLTRIEFCWVPGPTTTVPPPTEPPTTSPPPTSPPTTEDDDDSSDDEPRRTTTTVREDDDDSSDDRPPRTTTTTTAPPPVKYICVFDGEKSDVQEIQWSHPLYLTDEAFLEWDHAYGNIADNPRCKAPVTTTVAPPPPPPPPPPPTTPVPTLPNTGPSEVGIELVDLGIAAILTSLLGSGWVYMNPNRERAAGVWPNLSIGGQHTKGRQRMKGWFNQR